MVEASAPVKQTPVYLRKPVLKLLIVALLAEFGYAVMNIATMPVYLKDSRNFGESTIGLVLVAFLLSEAAFKSPMGHLADKYGPKRFMMIGPALSIGTSLISVTLPHRLDGTPGEVLLFIVLRAIDGIGAAMLWPAAFAEMNAEVDDCDRQQAMSLLNLCYMLGIALAFPLEGIANDVSGTKFAGLILAAFFFLAVSGTVYQFVPEVSRNGHSASAHDASLADFVASLKQIPEYLLLAIVTFAGIGFPMAIFKLFPQDEFGFSETQIGALIGPTAIVLGLASVPMSRVADRIGRARSVHFGLLMSALGMGAIASGAFAGSHYLHWLRQPWILAAAGIPVGIGFLLAIPAWMASVSDIDPERRGSNLGAVMTAQGLGAIIGAPIGAALYEKLQPLGIQLRLGPDFGRYSPFVGCAACLAAGWLLSLQVLKDRPPKSKPPDLGGAEREIDQPPLPLLGIVDETV